MLWVGPSDLAGCSAAVADAPAVGVLVDPALVQRAVKTSVRVRVARPCEAPSAVVRGRPLALLLLLLVLLTLSV